eukprot:3166070-Amphidinium_carterae.1
MASVAPAPPRRPSITSLGSISAPTSSGLNSISPYRIKLQSFTLSSPLAIYLRLYLSGVVCARGGCTAALA